MGPQINVSSTGLSAQTIDVLWVSSHIQIPDSLAGHLERRAALWQVVSAQDFLDNFAGFTIAGPILLDTTDIPHSRLDDLLAIIHRLDNNNIPTILLNNLLGIELTHFRLVSRLRGNSTEELWGRVDTALTFAKALSNTDSPQTALFRQTTEHLKMAGRVQRNFLPSKLPETPTVRFGTIFRPAEWVSGDIYDASRIDEQHIGFYIADAVGHSLPAALLTMFLKHSIVMRQTTGNQYLIFSPAEVIEHLNTMMYNQHLKGCLFATCCYALLNHQTLELTYARAGHPYPILIRPGQDPVQLQSHGGLLGVFEEMRFEQSTIQLRSGDKILLYSDGMEPILGQGEDAGLLVFNNFFNEISRLPLDEMLDRLEKTASEYHFPSGEIDDITALALEIL